MYYSSKNTNIEAVPEDITANTHCIMPWFCGSQALTQTVTPVISGGNFIVCIKWPGFQCQAKSGSQLTISVLQQLNFAICVVQWATNFQQHPLNSNSLPVFPRVADMRWKYRTGAAGMRVKCSQQSSRKTTNRQWNYGTIKPELVELCPS